MTYVSLIRFPVRGYLALRNRVINIGMVVELEIRKMPSTGNYVYFPKTTRFFKIGVIYVLQIVSIFIFNMVTPTFDSLFEVLVLKQPGLE